MHSAKVICDSISPDGIRLTTLEVVFPRIVLAEFNTHRVLSRNSASSRAIPVEKMVRMVMTNPYVPTVWTRNGKGMQGHGEITDPSDIGQLREYWMSARDDAVRNATTLLACGVHKQTSNRLLEPFMWHTAIVSSTEWSNFDHLRRHEAAHPDIQIAAECMHEARSTSTPTFIDYGEWHLPYVWATDRNLLDDEGFEEGDLVKISAGRCARVSYLTHDGVRDPRKDIDLHDVKLLAPGHMSPLEHPATPSRDTGFIGNFRGWVQHRKMIPGEEDILGYREAIRGGK